MLRGELDERRGIDRRGLPATAVGSKAPQHVAVPWGLTSRLRIVDAAAQIVKRPRILTPGPATRNFLRIRGRFLGQQAVGSLSSIYQYGLPSAADSPLQMRMAPSLRQFMPSSVIRHTALHWPSGPTTMTLSIADDYFPHSQAR